MRALGVAVLIVAGCASGPTRPAAARDALAALRASPVAREVARAAPDAYAEFAEAVARAEAASPGAFEDAVEDARIILSMARDRARVSVARERALAAARRADETDEATRRAEQQAEAIAAELDRAAQENATRERAARAVARPPTSAPERAAAAADLRQQAALLLAAARLLGAGDDVPAPIPELMQRAEAAARGADVDAAFVAAGRAYAAAERLVQGHAGSVGHDDPPGSLPSRASILGALSDGGGADPHIDARGVVAVLRGLFAGSALAPTSRSRVTTLANIVRTHVASHRSSAARVEVFVGGPAAAAVARATAQANALRAALVAAGVPAGRIEAQGLHRVPGGARSDDRVEVVLVTP